MLTKDVVTFFMDIDTGVVYVIPHIAYVILVYSIISMLFFAVLCML